MSTRLSFALRGGERRGQIAAATGAPAPDDAVSRPRVVPPCSGWLAGRRARRVVYAVLAAQVLTVAVFALVYRPFDLAIYLWGGRAVRQGLHLYAVQVKGNWYTYPPFAAVVFAPLAALPAVVTGLIWELGSVAALAWSARLILELGGYRPSRAVTAALTAAALALEPMYHTLYLGQVNIFLMTLVLYDLHRAARGKRTGIGIGVATAVKLVPGIFMPLLLLARRRRDAVIAALAFAACTAAGFAVNPSASRLYWTKLFDDTARVSPVYISNQSPYALLTRVAHGTSHIGGWYWAIPAVIGVLGLAASAASARRGDWLAATAICGITGLLVSPISWTHHWTWALPALLVVLRSDTTRARVAAGAGWLVFVLAPMWFTPWNWRTAQLGFHGLTTLVANCFLAAGLAFWAWMTWASWQGRPVPRAAPVPGTTAALGTGSVAAGVSAAE